MYRRIKELDWKKENVMNSEWLELYPWPFWGGCAEI